MATIPNLERFFARLTTEELQKLKSAAVSVGGMPGVSPRGGGGKTVSKNHINVQQRRAVDEV